MDIRLPALFLGGSTSLIESEDGGRFAFDYDVNAVGLLHLREICFEVLKHNPNGVIPFFDPNRKNEAENLVCEMNIQVPASMWLPHSHTHPGTKIIVKHPRQLLIAEPVGKGYFQLAFLSRTQLQGDEWFTRMIRVA